MDALTIASYVIAVVLIAGFCYLGSWLAKHKESVYQGLFVVAKTTFDTYGSQLKEKDVKLYDSVALTIDNLNKLFNDSGVTMDEWIAAFKDAQPILDEMAKVISDIIVDTADDSKAKA